MVAQSGQLDAAPNFGLALASRRGLFFWAKPQYLGDAARPQEGKGMKPQSRVGQYISCQTCHKPAGDHATKESGTCYDCSQRIIAEGRKREAAKESDGGRTRIGNTPTCDECGEQHSQDLTCEESAEMTACDPKQ